MCFGLIIRLVSKKMIEKLRKFSFLTCHVLISVPDYIQKHIDLNFLNLMFYGGLIEFSSNLWRFI